YTSRMDVSRFVRVAVNIPVLNGEFDYSVPDSLDGKVLPGCLVEVPFNNRALQGVVTRFVDIPEVADPKPVTALVDPITVVTSQQSELAVWMADETLTPICQCIDLMLPPGLASQADTLYENISNDENLRGLDQTETRIMQQLINRGSLRLHQLERAIPHVSLQGSLRKLQAAGRITSRSVLMPPRVRPKFVRTAALACSHETLEQAKKNLSIFPAVQVRRQRALEYLADEPLPVEVTWVYAASGCNMDDLIVLQELDLIVLNETEVWRDPLKKVVPLDQPAPELTIDQQNAWQSILPVLKKANCGEEIRPILLRGVTSSGKTELYLRAVEETLLCGRQAIILVPEISLTPLAVQRFLSRFPGQVGLIHSKLTPGERYDTWRRARAGVLPVIIGPRSALFAPLKNIGLIVVDECHDDSYYQDDFPPVYSALRVAQKMMRLNQSALILGSATPDVTQLYNARQGNWDYLELKNRVSFTQTWPAEETNSTITVDPLSDSASSLSQSKPISQFDSFEAIDAGLPPVEIVDMREELKAGSRSMFSRLLQTSIQKVLDSNEQAIIFLNRRGTSTFIFCYDCGHTIRCPRCEIPLTLHTSDNTLFCHHCGYKRNLPRQCPNCTSERIRHFGTGTERVENELKLQFPSARVLRWDAETTKERDSHEIILGHFTAHHADILVGTQMVAKGHDFPLVTLVGILLAETGLNMPDYRSPERTFQLITQVAGRAGRREKGGRVILQTYQPEHYAIKSAAEYDLDSFYDFEIAQRQRLHYPPFTRLARIIFQNLDEESCRIQAEKTREAVINRIMEHDLTATSASGALPCFFAREGGYYRYQIIIRSPDPVRVLRGIPLKNARIQIDPVDLL
ncbi:MAG: primosomal protein N', partial [Chloroflexi bacterium]|nr:primosomal protein N' [Chloroflexota bacterium]